MLVVVTIARPPRLFYWAGLNPTRLSLHTENTFYCCDKNNRVSNPTDVINHISQMLKWLLCIFWIILNPMGVWSCPGWAGALSHKSATHWLSDHRFSYINLNLSRTWHEDHRKTPFSLRGRRNPTSASSLCLGALQDFWGHTTYILWSIQIQTSYYWLTSQNNILHFSHSWDRYPHGITSLFLCFVTHCPWGKSKWSTLNVKVSSLLAD